MDNAIDMIERVHDISISTMIQPSIRDAPKTPTEVTKVQTRVLDTLCHQTKRGELVQRWQLSKCGPFRVADDYLRDALGCKIDKRFV